MAGSDPDVPVVSWVPPDVGVLPHSRPRKPGNLAMFLEILHGPILALREHCDLTVQPPEGFQGDAC